MNGTGPGVRHLERSSDARAISRSTLEAGESDSSASFRSREREVERDLSMYRFYVGFLIKGTAFACALTGAIVSFYFSHRDIPHTIWSMFLPILVNGGFMTVCLSSLEPARRMQVGHRSLCRAAGMVHSYDLGLLPKLLMIIAVTFAVMTCGLIVLLCVDANGRI